MAARVTDGDDGALVGLKISPGASRDALLGEYDGRLKLAVRQPPERGRANKGVVALLSKRLGVPKKFIEIVAGHASPVKTVLFRDQTADTMREKIERALSEDRP